MANSNAFTLATLGMVRAELERGEVVPVLHEPWMRTEWSIMRLRKRTMSPAMMAFVEELKRTHSDVLRQEAQLRMRWHPAKNKQAQSVKPAGGRSALKSQA